MDYLPETPPPADELPPTPPPNDELPDTPPPVELSDTPPPQNIENNEDELPDTPPPRSFDICDTPPPKHVENDYDSFDEDVPTSTQKSKPKDYDSFDEDVPNSTKPQDYDSFDEDVPGSVKQTNDENDSFDEFETVSSIKKKAVSNEESMSSSSSEAENSDSDFEPDETQPTQKIRSKRTLRGRNSKQTEEKSQIFSKRGARNVVLAEDEFFTTIPKQTEKVDDDVKKRWGNMEKPPAEVLRALNEFYGHKMFRDKQWNVIRNVLNEKDQFVLMSTGYGKSVCYQLPSLLLNTMTIVISPLISLMNDQVTTLVAKGIEAIKLDGDSSLKDWQYVLDNVANLRFLYMSPELSTTQKGMELMGNCKEYLSLIAIDEAHCVSQWGHDFRSSYRHLSSIRNRSDLCHIPMIALTATATVRVQKDIVANLKLRNPQITTTSFDRKNLYISVHSQTNLDTDLGELLILDEKEGRHFGGPTIIYCQTKQSVDDVNTSLRRLGVKSSQYHAGMTKNQREKAHTEFMRDKINTIVATVAFGMGIDKPDVRNVIHYGLPKDIESYYQEMGRAGRDGAPSTCRVFWSQKNIITNKYKLNSNNCSEEVHQNSMAMMRQLEVVMTTNGCRRFQLLKHFDPNIVKNAQPQPGCCDRCTDMLNGDGTSSNSMNVSKEAKWMFQVIGDLYNRKTGIGKPIDYLKGNAKEEWRAKTHTQRQLFGIGKQLTEKWWRALGSALRLAGYLEEFKPMDFKFGTFIALSDQASRWMVSGCKELMIESSPILLQGKAEKIKNQPNTSGTSNSGTTFVEEKILGNERKNEYKSATGMDDLQNVKESCDDEEKIRQLRSQLDDLRIEMANMYEMAPFQVVSNTVLNGLAHLRPGSISKLNVIDGMSAAQQTKYGKRFVDFVVKFSNENGISLNVNSNEAIPKYIQEIMDQLPDTVKKMYSSHIMGKMNAKQLATTRGVSEGTVFNYLCSAVEKGLPVFLEKMNVNRQMIDFVLEATRNKLGSNVARLTPMMETLPKDAVDFNRLKLIRSVLIYEYGLKEIATKKLDQIEESSTSPPKPAWMKASSRPSNSSTHGPQPKKFKL